MNQRINLLTLLLVILSIPIFWWLFRPAPTQPAWRTGPAHPAIENQCLTTAPDGALHWKPCK